MQPLEDDIVIVGKGDQISGVSNTVSGLTGEGVPQLVSRITSVLLQRSSTAGIATRERHRVALVRGDERLNAAQGLLVGGEEFADIAAEEMRAAIRALDSLVGRVDVESVLDEIFASFCLGK